MEDTIQELLKDRHVLDAIARAVVTGERGLGEVADKIADDIASIMINRLAASEAQGHGRVAHLEWNVPQCWQAVEDRYGREFLGLLIRRTDKHLAYAAMIALTRGKP